MINRIYRLMDTKRIEMVQREVQFMSSDVLIKPDYLSICAADRRYYMGRRKKEILNQKLPMALIHEATGTVLRDPSGQLAAGAKVVLIPLEPENSSNAIKSNYRQGSKFASSGPDGFMRDTIALPHDRLIPVSDDYSEIYVFSELLSVALGAIQAFENLCRIEKDIFGVWGDGSMGFVMSLALRCQYPDAEIYVFGKTARKLQKFSFVTKTFYIDQVPQGLKVSHCFECVGNTGSEAAISQMMELISPQGSISLLGVSEDSVAINTRSVLDKGLYLIGNSRSDAEDFKKAVTLIRENEICRRYLQILISEVIEIKTENDIHHAFEQDVLNDFKTVLKWSI